MTDDNTDYEAEERRRRNERRGTLICKLISHKFVQVVGGYVHKGEACYRCGFRRDL